MSWTCHSFVAALRYSPELLKVRVFLIIKVLHTVSVYLLSPRGPTSPAYSCAVLQGCSQAAHGPGHHGSLLGTPAPAPATPNRAGLQLSTALLRPDPPALASALPWPPPSSGDMPKMSWAGAAPVPLRQSESLPASPGIPCSSQQSRSWGAAGPHGAVEPSSLSLTGKLLSARVVCSHIPQQSGFSAGFI